VRTVLHDHRDEPVLCKNGLHQIVDFAARVRAATIS